MDDFNEKDIQITPEPEKEEVTTEEVPQQVYREEAAPEVQAPADEEDYSNPDKYKFNPITGERNVKYTYIPSVNEPEPVKNYAPQQPAYMVYGEANRAAQPAPKKKGIKTWLIVLIAIAAAIIVAVSSIVIYSTLTNATQLPPEDVEQDLVEDYTDEEDDKPADTEEEKPEDEHSSVDLELNTGSAGALLNGDVNLTEIANKTIESVVCIQTYVEYAGGGLPGYEQASGGINSQLYGEGSGVVITEDGYVITNQHVIAGGDAVQVIMSDGEIYDAEIIGEDEDSDIALIKITPEKNIKFSPITIGDSDELEVASYVMAVGNPGGSEFSSSVTLGIVSATERPITISSGYTIDMIQTDAAINPGNSGGALVNMNGELVGICSAKYVATGYENMGFAITVNEAVEIANELADYGYVRNRGTIGIKYQVLTSSRAQYYNVPEGIYVTEITGDCGTLGQYDIITEIDGRSVKSNAEMSNALKGKEVGDKVKIRYYDINERKYYDTEVELIASEKESNEQAPQQGGEQEFYDYNDYYGSDFYDFYEFFSRW